VYSQPLGGHAVKIVGYGVDNGMKYWTVANSWNAEFGEVLRGYPHWRYPVGTQWDSRGTLGVL
jgi:cathepsin B